MYVCNALSAHQNLRICIACNSGGCDFLLRLLWQLTLIFVKCDVAVVRQLHHELDELWEDALLCPAFLCLQKLHCCCAVVAVTLPKPQRYYRIQEGRTPTGYFFFFYEVKKIIVVK